MSPRDPRTLTAATIWGQSVATDGTGTVEAARRVVTAIGTNMASGGKGALIYVWGMNGNMRLKTEKYSKNDLLLKQSSEYSLLAQEHNFTFTSQAIDVTELIAAAAVALIGAEHVGALLTAWVALTLVQICTKTIQSNTC